ncbi:hypothetical protein Tco_0835327 [Tanacetum coccineum]
MLAPSSGGLIFYQAYGNLYAMTGRKVHLLEDKQIPTLGWHLEEIHVTWAHLEKNQTRLQTYTKSLKKLCIQSVETARRGRRDLQLGERCGATASDIFVTPSGGSD